MKSKPKASTPRKLARRARRPYRSPKLVAYGDVRRLTDAVDNAGSADGGYGGGMVRT
ncbi:MAG: hypothetical protein IT513_00720 [Burkholderiales bacterium]|nr:hypothetical protein [Burkholderiales bacterium]